MAMMVSHIHIRYTKEKSIKKVEAKVKNSALALTLRSINGFYDALSTLRFILSSFRSA